MAEAAQNVAAVIGDILCDEHKLPLNLSRYDAEDVAPIREHLDRVKLGNFRKRSS